MYSMFSFRGRVAFRHICCTGCVKSHISIAYNGYRITYTSLTWVPELKNVSYTVLYRVFNLKRNIKCYERIPSCKKEANFHIEVSQPYYVFAVYALFEIGTDVIKP
jgi:hypothetical protein